MPGTIRVDLSHHLSEETRSRKPNAMKALWRLTKRKPNMISLGTGELASVHSTGDTMLMIFQATPITRCIP